MSRYIVAKRRPDGRLAFSHYYDGCEEPSVEEVMTRAIAIKREIEREMLMWAWRGDYKERTQ